MSTVVINLFKMVLSNKYFCMIMSVFVLLSTSLMIIKNAYRSDNLYNVADYKNISSVKIDFGGNVNYRIYTGNKPVIVKRVKSYEGDILILYIKLDTLPEIKTGDK